MLAIGAAANAVEVCQPPDPIQVTAVAPRPAIMTDERGLSDSDTLRESGQRVRSRSASVGTRSCFALCPSPSGRPL